MSKKSKIEITVEVFENQLELPNEIQELMKKAELARNDAYAPYSQFSVGAAILLDSGEITIGNNQENAAYPSGLCAERVAVFHCGARFPQNTIKALAITAASKTHQLVEPIAPCGACRQALSEYEIKQQAPIAIYFMGETGEIIKVGSLKDLLPLRFDAKHL